MFKKTPRFYNRNKLGVIVLEVDEHQHSKGYPCACELSRMKQIYMDLGYEKVLFIRYNPDEYVSVDEMIPDIKRHAILIKVLKNKMKMTEIEWNLASIYLFYDGFTKSSIDTEIFDPYKIEFAEYPTDS